MNVSDASDDTSSMLAAASSARQKWCATIVEEAEIDDCDDGGRDDSNDYGAEGRTVIDKKNKLEKIVCVCACFTLSAAKSVFFCFFLIIRLSWMYCNYYGCTHVDMWTQNTSGTRFLRVSWPAPILNLSSSESPEKDAVSVFFFLLSARPKDCQFRGGTQSYFTNIST